MHVEHAALDFGADLKSLGNGGKGHIRQLPQVHVPRNVVAELHLDALIGA